MTTPTTPRVHLRQLLTAPDIGDAFTCDWDYRATDPLAVHLTIRDHRHQPPRIVSWCMARDLLSDALTGHTVGHGDVQAWRDTLQRFAVQLRGDDGATLTLTGDPDDLDLFLQRSYEAVPSEHEHTLVAEEVDGLADELAAHLDTPPERSAPSVGRLRLRLVLLMLGATATLAAVTGGLAALAALAAAAISGWLT